MSEGILELAEQWQLANNAPSMRHINMVEQGYTLVDVTPEEIVVTHRLIDTHDPEAVAHDGARFRLQRGSSRIETLPASRTAGSFA